jgi:hypothetical protein
MMFSEIKFSPLILFIIILLVLVIATTVKNLGLVSEGFNSYLQTTAPFADIKVNAYDNTRNIRKLYDEVFYDSRNGNAVVVYGAQYDLAGGAAPDTTGSTITKIDVIPRDIKDNIVTYTNSANNQLTQRCEESKKTSIDTIDTQWSKKFTNNQLNYVTMGPETFLYVIDLTSTKTSGNTIAGNTSLYYTPAVTSYYKGTDNTYSSTYSDKQININISSSYTYSNGDGKDDTFVVDDYYHATKKVYQLTQHAKYDISNGNLIVQTVPNGSSKKIDVFYRDSLHLDNPIPDFSNNSQIASTTDAADQVFRQTTNHPYFIQNPLDNQTIMYWPNNDNTILIVFANALDSDGAVKVVKCKKFTKDGVYTDSSTTTPPPSPQPVDNTANADLLNAFSRWYIYFNANGVGNVGDSSDYLLKTQIVPPVCPACPGCKGVCTDCGGNGGSGTKASDKSSMAFDNNTVVGSTGNLVNNTVGAAGNIVNSTVGTAGNIVNSTVDTAGNVVGKTVDVAGNVVGKTLDTAGNIVGKTFDTAGNIVGKTFDAAGNLLGSTADRLGLDRKGYQQSYGGPTNTSSSANATGYPSSGYNNTTYRPGSNTTGVSTLPNASPKDQYSYNGALQPKGGNYMSMSSDFSRFGR